MIGVKRSDFGVGTAEEVQGKVDGTWRKRKRKVF